MQVCRINIVALLLISSAVSGGDLVLVENGKANATIVLAETPSRSARFAVRELNLHLEKSTGVELPITNGNHAVDRIRVLVGESKATLELNLKNSDFSTQEYLIRFLPDTLVLMGRDAEDVASRLKPGTKPAVNDSPPTFWGTEEMGTCYAVYDFLERCCDVRWYGPGEIGMVYPTTKTLRVGGENIRRAPAFLSRRSWPFPAYSPKGLCANLWGHPEAKDVQDFGRRMRFGGEKYTAGHSFDGYYPRFWKKDPKKPNVFEENRPRYFAKGYEQENRPPQPCLTNPDLVQQVIQDARDFFDRGVRYDRGFATGDYFPIGPEDNNRYCKCPACQAFDDKEKMEAANHFFMNGRWSNYHFQFVNRVAKAIKQSHPDKYISALAYWDFAYHPSNVKLEPNISIQLCLDCRQWAYPHNKRNDLFFYRDWLTKEPGRRFYVRAYYCFPELSTRSGRFNCFPAFVPHTTARNIRMFHRDGIRGVSFDGLGEQLDVYVAFKMLDDPTLDVEVLLDEFFARYYGGAGDAMKRIYQKIEDIYSTTSNYPESVITGERITHQNEEIAWAYLGTEGRMADLDRLMVQARASARTDMGKKRVGLFEDAIWNYMVEGRRKYLRRKGLAAFEAAHLDQRLPDKWKLMPDPSKEGVGNRWFDIDFDDTSWREVSILKTLEKQGYKNYGYAWYRTEVLVPKEEKGRKIILRFGAVDETCWLWINAKPAGEFLYNPTLNPNGWKEPLRFDITKLVKFGEKNQIAVQVHNVAGAGGIWQASHIMYTPPYAWNPDWCTVISPP